MKPSPLPLEKREGKNISALQTEALQTEALQTEALQTEALQTEALQASTALHLLYSTEK